MSLVGSLEDLGLGEILQIISLSRKSGILRLRSREGAGHVVFREGEIQAARLAGGVSDLADLLVAQDVLEPGTCADLQAEALRTGTPFEVVVASRAVPVERLDELRQEHVEQTVLAMFQWAHGEFSFEIGAAADADDALALASGLNPQFLALEGTRLQDEQRNGARPVAEVLEAEVARLEEAEGALERELVEPKDLEPIVDAVVDEPSRLATRGDARDAPAVIVIGRELHLLETVKEALSNRFERVHIFQRSDLAIGRIRQYLARAETPCVLLSPDAPPDPLSGARDWRELLARLKAQARSMSVFLIRTQTSEPLRSPPLLDGVLSLAPATPGGAPGLPQALEQALRADPTGPQPELLSEALVQLREASDRLQDPESRAEVLPLLLRAATALYARVAIFMVRDQMLVGMAQIGLPRAGGPDDVGLRGLVVPAAEPAWFRRVLESGVGGLAPPSNLGDERLAGLLGDRLPHAAYVAPILSGPRVVALLYADNLPGDEALADPGALEPLLVEAGLALERALRARALAP